MKKAFFKSKYFNLFLIVLTISSATLSLFFYVKMKEENKLLSEFIIEALNGKTLNSREDTVLAISQGIYNTTNNWITRDKMDWYSEWEATNFFKMSTGVGLKYKCYGVKGHPDDGPCGTMTKIFLRALWELGIPVRKLQLSEYIPGKGGHTMAEYFDNGKWRVISPSDNGFIWRNTDGSAATVQEIQRDTAVFNQVYYKWRKNWQYGFKETWNINWNKIPGSLRSAIRFIIGEEAYRNAETPEIYENPRRLFFYICIVLFVFSTMILIALHRSYFAILLRNLMRAKIKL